MVNVQRVTTRASGSRFLNFRFALCPQPVLECAVQRGLVYNKVNPIFHHWRVEDRKFGLTFQSPADAISFEKGLQTVIDKLDRGT